MMIRVGNSHVRMSRDPEGHYRKGDNLMSMCVIKKFNKLISLNFEIFS